METAFTGHDLLTELMHHTQRVSVGSESVAMASEEHSLMADFAPVPMEIDGGSTEAVLSSTEAAPSSALSVDVSWDLKRELGTDIEKFNHSIMMDRGFVSV